MTTLAAADRNFWPTGDEETLPGFKVLAHFRYSDLDAQVYTTDADHSFHLTWTDGVANSWHETYLTFHHAVARAAVLAYCEMSEWNLFARQTNEADFAQVAKHFFRNTTT